VTVYLTADDVETVTERYGYTVRDFGLILSAINRPAASAFGEDAYPTIWLKAAALLESVARNHALVEGNKRTALRLTALFLRLNGWHWTSTVPDDEEFVVYVAQGEIDVDKSANYLESHSIPA
jgi:death-on-curing protein